MASPVSVKVEGLNRVVRDLQAMGVEVTDLKDAFGAIATEGAQIVRGFVPVVSGALAGSVRGNRAKNKAVVFTGRASVPYAGPINYGWEDRNIEPADFFGSADAVLEPLGHKKLDESISRLITKKGLA